MNWTESLESCHADGQALASIRSKQEHDKYVQDMPKGKRKAVSFNSDLSPSINVYTAPLVITIYASFHCTFNHRSYFRLTSSYILVHINDKCLSLLLVKLNINAMLV